MKLSFREEELAFEADVAAFVDQWWPPPARTQIRNPAFARRWYDALVARGWSVPLWPVAVGGLDWTPTQKFIWERSTALAGTPVWDPCGAALAGPLIYNFGNVKQQDRWLPSIRALKLRWCHGFAVRDPGQVTVTAVGRSEGVVASGYVERVAGAADGDYLLCLVRGASDLWPELRSEVTEQSPEGVRVSLVVIDLNSPGATVEDATIVLNEVAVDATDRIGDAHQGWSYATTVLDHERAAVQRVTVARYQLEELKSAIGRTPDGEGRTLSEDEDLARKVAGTEVALASLEALELRVLSDLVDGNAPGAEALALQIKGGELLARVGELIVESLGYYAMPYPDEHLIHNEGPVGPDYALPAIRGMLFDRSWSAYSPNPELERDRVAELLLSPDKN